MPFNLDELIQSKIDETVQSALAADAVLDAAELAAAVQAALAADAIVDAEQLTVAIQAALDADAVVDAEELSAAIAAALAADAADDVVVVDALNATIAARDAEIVLLKARIAELEAGGGGTPSLPPPEGPPVVPEMIVKAWYQDTLPDGPVGSWQSFGVKPRPALQIDLVLQPTKLPDKGGVLFANGTKHALKWQADNDCPWLHRWWIVIARCPASTIPVNTNVPVFCVNGNTGGSGHRQPRVVFTPGNFASHLHDGATRIEGGPSSPDGNVWNVLVGYRRGRVLQSVVNGVKSPGQPLNPLPPNEDNMGSTMGYDGGTGLGADVAIDCIILGQSEIDDATIDKLVGWGMWRVGRQAELPVDHPYRDVAPTEITSPPRYVFDQARWDAWDASQTDAVRWVNRGQPAPSTDGYVTVFEDEFLTHTVVDDLQGPADANWFAPTHLENIGSDAKVQKLNSPTNCYIHDPVNHTMSLRLQSATNPTTGAVQWRTGAFSSVDKNGHGRTWGKGIFEIRCKFPALPSPRPGFFPAFWAYNWENLYWRTRNRLETDFFEYDGLNGAWINASQHVHKPRIITTNPEVRPADVRKKIAGFALNTNNGFPALIDIYDGQFHTWYWQIEDDWTYIVIDGLEVARCPTSPELAAEKYIMVDYAYRTREGLGDPTQVYDMTIDYIRVRQKG